MKLKMTDYWNRSVAIIHILWKYSIKYSYWKWCAVNLLLTYLSNLKMINDINLNVSASAENNHKLIIYSFSVTMKANNGYINAL